MFMCRSCKHNKVCKNRERFEKSLEICKDFDNSNNPETYGNIYDMFQPIFEWMQKHYPSGEMFFIVDSRSARMYHDYKVSAYDKNMTKDLRTEIKKAFSNDEEKQD